MGIPSFTPSPEVQLNRALRFPPKIKGSVYNCIEDIDSCLPWEGLLLMLFFSHP
jgi:hypothetical protein